MRTISFLSTVAIALVAINAGIGYSVNQTVTDLRNERLGRECMAGLQDSCEELVRVTDGVCAGPEWSGCVYGVAERKAE